MPEPDARSAVGVYDLEEEIGPTRRRRVIADWGVGEDAFAHMPSRRFTRDDRTARRAGRTEPPRSEFTPTADVTLALDADLGPAPDRRAHTDSSATVDTAVTKARAAAPGPPVSGSGTAVAGRRTIVIGQRSTAMTTSAAQRRRPPRTAAQRVGARPDRIVGWMVALGFLLILIAILSAGQ